jgi:hypothetical protein
MTPEAGIRLGSVPNGAQYKEERQGHERYEEPRPHRRNALAGGARGLGGIFGHRRSARVKRGDVSLADRIRVHIEGDEGG